MIRSTLPAALLLAAAAAGAAETSLIATRSGPLLDDGSGNVHAFLGIPYAAPPVGALRWKPPQPPASWTSPRAAADFGAACPQPEDKLYLMTPEVRSEDCLYLNVWAPTRGAAALPVMVWVHGGSNRMGAGSLSPYNGAGLAGRGVVVVTINYRIGLLGFMAHDALEGGGGNFAYMDQVAALEWVRDNIAAFGGDAGNVTLMGESAGGGNILYLMASPKAQGLFHRAIVQSGGGWHRAPTREQAVAQTLKKLEAGGLEKLGAPALRKLSAEKLVEATLLSGLPSGPFIDGAWVTDSSWTAFEAGRQSKVPLIIGSNDWEANLLKGRDLGFIARAIAWVPGVMGWYDDSRQAVQEQLFRDAVFGASARWVAQRHSAQAPTWLYHFSRVRHGKKGKVPGAMHADEIPYVLDNMDAAVKTFGEASDADRGLSTALADCWASFARLGKPDCSFEWTPYTRSNDAVLEIGDDVKLMKHPQGQVLDKVTNWFGPGTLLAF